MMKKYLIILLALVTNLALAKPKDQDYQQLVQPAVFSITMVMMHDVVNPPAASRYYAYCTMGADAILAMNDSTIKAPSSYIKNLPKFTINTTDYDAKLAALYCILESGRLLLPSGFQLETEEIKLLLTAKKMRLAADIIERSKLAANEVAAQVVSFSQKDNYGKLSTRLRYRPVKGDGYWYPTPPAYIEAVEPHWKTIRPLIIDSCGQFPPLAPTAYSNDTNSLFYKQAYEVYSTGTNPTKEQLNIASFWDCNPFVVSTAGHMSLGFKKISPGGHWMNIACLASQKAGFSFAKTIQVLTIEAAVLMDAFISCWDEKYRSNRIRPETYINKHIDIKWLPVLQTPPFPEYTSGHSVVSAASAEVLSYFFGSEFAYTDNTEEMFEIGSRQFTSFRQAANEAAISRLYGGIHYRDAIENGLAQGKALGQFVVAKIGAANVY